MSIRSAVASPLWLVVAFALACGGGTTKTDDGTGDEGLDVDTIQPDNVGDEGAKDLVPGDDGTVGPDDRLDVPTDEVTPPKDVIDADAPPPVDVPDVIKDTQQDIPPKMCPCDETVVGSEVCLLEGACGKTEFKSDICAKCAVCAPNEFCPDCGGTKTDCADLPAPNYFSWKGTCEACPCKLQEECDRLVYPDCGKVCALKGAEQVEYADLCAMKADFCCGPDYDENLQNFGACPKPVCEACLENQPENPVCGSDGKTYTNQCSLVNCPSAVGITRTCLGACVGKDFCPACPATCAPVCGDDNVTYASACAATTCGTKEKKVAYEGACCPECDADPMVEVCATNGEAYPNQCYALCHGATPCGSAGPAVCGLDGKDWPNACWSTCKAGGSLHSGACTRLCEQCPTTYTPVCATGPDGKLHTYQSDCFKDCQGGTGGTAGLCAECTTLCQNATPETVCGADGITYPNSCIPQKCMLITFKAGACS